MARNFGPECEKQLNERKSSNGLSRPWPTVSGSLGIPKVARHFSQNKNSKRFFFSLKCRRPRDSLDGDFLVKHSLAHYSTYSKLQPPAHNTTHHNTTQRNTIRHTHTVHTPHTSHNTQCSSDTLSHERQHHDLQQDQARFIQSGARSARVCLDDLLGSSESTNRELAKAHALWLLLLCVAVAVASCWCWWCGVFLCVWCLWCWCLGLCVCVVFLALVFMELSVCLHGVCVDGVMGATVVLCEGFNMTTVALITPPENDITF